MPLNILLPNGEVLAVQMYIKDAILGPIPWDGVVSVGPSVGGATEAKQDVGNTSLASIDTKLTGPIQVSVQGTPNVTVNGGQVGIMGNDPNAGPSEREIDTTTVTPIGTEQGLIVRNIPSGTQVISGAVTIAALTDGTQKAQIIDGSGQVATVVVGAVNSLSVIPTNGSGANALNIQDGGNNISIDDGGNSITIDGSITSIPSNTIINGTITASAQNVSITLAGEASIVMIWSGAASAGLLAFQASPDGGTTWVTVQGAHLQPSSGTPSIRTSIPADGSIAGGAIYFQVAGMSDFRVLSSGWGAGTVTIKLSSSITSPTQLQLVALHPSITSNVTASVSGAKSNNTSVPGTTNLGVLPAIANAAAPTYIEGNQVAASVDLAGNLRVTSSPASSEKADIFLTSDDAGYVDGQLNKNLTQTPDGRLRTNAALVGKDTFTNLYTEVAATSRDQGIKDNGIIVRPIDPNSSAMLNLLSLMYEELIAMRTSLADLSSNDLKQSIIKSNRYSSGTARAGVGKWE